MDYYRRGFSRRVLKFNKFVIKFPVLKVFTMKELIDCYKGADASVPVKIRTFILNFLYGFWCNYHENQVYLKIKETVYNVLSLSVYCAAIVSRFITPAIIRPEAITIKEVTETRNAAKTRVAFVRYSVI